MAQFNRSRAQEAATMRIDIRHPFRRLSLTQQFMLASLVILVAGMLGVGWWVGQKIEAGVVHSTAATTALYVDSFISPELQELGGRADLTPEHINDLQNLLHETSLGQQIVAFKVWDPTGRVLYSTDTETIGRTFPVHEKLKLALEGKVASSISDLEDLENLPEQAIRSRLLETYSPIRLNGTNQIIAVAEFYQIVDDLQQEISSAQRTSWLVFGATALVMYLLLAGFVQRASDTIVRQQTDLNQQVIRLTDLLAQNQALHARVQRASASVAALNEGFLRRVGAELHDGPAQDLSLALLRLDTVAGLCEAYQDRVQDEPAASSHLRIIKTSLEHALQEIRTIAAGLSLPHLSDLTLDETATRAVRAHIRRTGTKVMLRIENLPEHSTLPVRITLYRVVQEALNNAYRHAGGIDQQVRIKGNAGQVQVEVSDRGPGFDVVSRTRTNGHLGLLGMRERVESQGGRFEIESIPGQGTRVRAYLPLGEVGDIDE